jgi:crotonobetainyl-CoA:carnitine CoA-transferase CaiB-like acyl-CoA transferase
MASVMDGIRVIDFGQYVAGPLTAMLLADQGADVIRVDPPGGPRLRTPANATWNRGKRSIVLDLKTAEDLAVARRLVQSADVVVENFRPGVMERLGLGPEAMLAANPRLVYCSLPGFASDDPRAGVAAWEGVVAAAADTYRPPRDGSSEQPVYTALPLSSNFAAFLATTAITVALIARERDGLGQRIEVPLFDATFVAFGGFSGRLDRMQRLRGGAGVYQCADGRWIFFHPGNPRFLDWLVDGLGLTDWREAALLDHARRRADPELDAELTRRLEALFRTRTAQEWEDRLNELGLPCSICRSAAEWLENEHARASGTVVEVADPEYGRMLQPGTPVRAYGLDAPNVAPRRSLDADRERVIAELGKDDGAAGSAESGSGDPSAVTHPGLADFRVLDLTQVLAGPTSGRTLAEFGAQVIKINDPKQSILTHQDVNRGKETILLDLETPAGLEVFWRLLEDADVVMQNFRLGTAERLGIGYEQVRARRPDVVYVSVSAYGYDGPWGERRGYETMGQATSGLQVRSGGDGPPAGQPFAVNDYGTGLLGALATVFGLFHRVRTGEGLHVAAALAYTATIHQSPYFNWFEGKEWTEPRGQRALGSGPLHRLYRASDGWFFLGTRPDDLPCLAAVEGLAGIDGVPADALAAFLEERLAGDTVASWVERLTAAGAGAHRLVSANELMEDPWVRAHGLAVTREHDGVGSFTTIGPAARLQRTPMVLGRPVPQPGADAPAVLASIGMRERLDELVQAGAVAVPALAPA